MEIFGENAERIVDGYSEEFEETFMEHIKRSHKHSRMAATVLYNEYISDRHHVHMNSTKWTTLTEFVKHLGRTGQCKVEETPKGWFMTYIDREPETLLKEGLKLKRERAELADEERHDKALEEQIERASKMARVVEEDVPEEKKVFQRDDAGKRIAFALAGQPEDGRVGSLKGPTKFQSKPSKPLPSAPADVFGQNDEDFKQGPSRAENSVKEKTSSSGRAKGGASAIESLIREEELAKERAIAKAKTIRKDYWLSEGLVVKVMSKALKEKGFYKQKGVVAKVIDKYVGEIEMLDGGALLRIDQQELETVLPQIGGLVQVVNGAYRDTKAKLLSINTDRFTASIQLQGGSFEGRILSAVDYEDICKVHT
eukprot:jgi/Mesen1/5859/ME000298S05132